MSRGVTALESQLDYLEARSAFYRERIQGRRELTELPLLTKDELRESQQRQPPFGEHLCARPEELVRLHVTSGTTGEPVAIGLTQHDHEANSQLGGEAFAIAGLLPTDAVAHCLNYALYAGGIADHMAIEASGATVVPVGVGQSNRLLDLIPRLGITAIFGTLSFPAYLAAKAREQDLDPTTLGLRHIVTAGEPGAGLAAVRAEIERAWNVTVADTFGMSDVWSTMAGECGRSEGLHLTTGEHALLEVIDPETAEPLPFTDGVHGELVWTHLDRQASPLLRYRSSDLATVWTDPCPCGRTTPRIRIGGRRDDMLRVQAVNVYPQAIGELLHGARHAIVADGDPIVPPLHVYVEGDPDPQKLRAALRTDIAVHPLAPGTLPVAEHKTAKVFRTAQGDQLPEAIRRAHERQH